MGRALLGELAEHAYIEIQVGEDRDPQTGYVNQLTIFVSLSAWENSGLHHGTIVMVDLHDHSIPGGVHVWVPRHPRWRSSRTASAVPGEPAREGAVVVRHPHGIVDMEPRVRPLEHGVPVPTLDRHFLSVPQILVEFVGEP
ncbi:MAG: hypothetical protein Q8Q85_06025 [Gemmatimonadales bacterium]|nr:hypothetical protein [Gemmatimonadales bacterium]